MRRVHVHVDRQEVDLAETGLFDDPLHVLARDEGLDHLEPAFRDLAREHLFRPRDVRAGALHPKALPALGQQEPGVRFLARFRADLDEGARSGTETLDDLGDDGVLEILREHVGVIARDDLLALARELVGQQPVLREIGETGLQHPDFVGYPLDQPIAVALRPGAEQIQCESPDFVAHQKTNEGASVNGRARRETSRSTGWSGAARR